MSTPSLIDRGLIPDWLIRYGIRHLLRKRLREQDCGSPEANTLQLAQYIDALRRSPIAVDTGAANDQHYEVPAEFFEKVLGHRMKYSAGLWTEHVTSLDEAEEEMLDVTVSRADIEDGMDVLDLGCGWGSMALYIAERFPNCSILAVSNSRSQRAFILERCRARGLENVDVVTRDINDFETTRRFDRVVSVEMFEHVQNYADLMKQIARWLRPAGRLFVHIFVHREFAYAFETEGAANWLGRHFFTGGQMPSVDLLKHFQDDLELECDWNVSGMHYATTARAWLENLDRRRGELLELLAEDLGRLPAKVMLRRWRVFFMACEELWKFRGGREWFVQHYSFRPHVRIPAIEG